MVNRPRAVIELKRHRRADFIEVDRETDAAALARPGAVMRTRIGAGAAWTYYDWLPEFQRFVERTT